ncbi:MAG: DUF1801 domain-containing protein [Chloroflexota bacterium]
MSKARLGSFNDLMAERTADSTPAIEQICRRLREIVYEDDPNSVEVVRLGDGAAAYGVGPKKMSESHVYIMPKAEYVNLGLWHGVNVPDPSGLLEGTGKNMRHIKIRSLDDANNPAVRDIIAEALKERKAALGIE